MELVKLKQKDLFVAISFANILFYNFWSIVVYFNPGNSFYYKNSPTAKTFLAFIICELIVGLVIWLGIKLIRYLNNSLISKSSMFIFCCVVLNFFYDLIWNTAQKIKVEDGFIHRIPTNIYIIFVIYLIVRKRTFKTVKKAVLLLTPFVLMIFGQAIMMMGKDFQNDVNYQYVNPAATQKPPFFQQDKSSPRILWLLFDEMDQRLTFDQRPKYVKLPEFDRFKEQAFYAVNVKQAGKNTGRAVPSLFTGKLVKKTGKNGPSEFLITYEGESKPVKMSQEPDIFTEVKELGFNTALSGNGHPYSRVMGHKIDFCEWYDDDMILSPDASLLENISNQLRYLSPFDRGQRGRMLHSKLFKDAQKLAVDPDYQLIFIHFAIPHAPRINKKWGLVNITQWGYFGNLELADQTFGILRKSMEEQGFWDNTVILVTSDHQWRKSNRIDGKKDPRVPFILKLPGEKDGVVYKPSFNAVLTKEILIGILKKDIRTYNDLTKWLNEQQNN